MATPRLITKEVAKWATDFSSAFPYVENPDPTLDLARRDESIYRDMRAWTGLGVGLTSRRETLLSSGWNLVAGTGPKAKEVHDWTVAAISGIRDVHTVLQMSHEALGAGWKPFELLWESYQYQGREYWRIREIHEQKQEEFAFDVDRNLVQLPRWEQGGSQYKTWRIGRSPSAPDVWKWWVVRFGSTAIPYGQALLSEAWALWYVYGKFQLMYASAMSKSQGILQVDQVGQIKPASQGGTAPDEEFKLFKKQVQDVSDTLQSSGVLLVPPGMKVDFLTDVTASSTWLESLEFFIKQGSLVTTGQHLANSQEGSGSRAASETQRKSLVDRACSDGRVIGESFTRGIIDLLYAYNLGDVAPEDRSHLRFNLCHQLDLARLAMVPESELDRVDWSAVLDDGHIPMLTDEEVEEGRRRKMEEARRAMASTEDEDDDLDKEDDKEDEDPDEDERDE